VAAEWPEKTVLLQNESGTPVLVVVASGARPGLPILLRATWRTASLSTFSEDCEPFLFKDEASVRGFLFSTLDETDHRDIFFFTCASR
jgi:hypothetical protein